MEPQPPDLSGTVLAGKYRLHRVLGSGGMGTVYEAVQEDLGRAVAVKVLHPQMAHEPELVERFRREALAAAALGHPHIVQVTDFQAGRPPFIVMEHLAGQSLRDLLRTTPVIAPSRIAHIALQVLSALAAAHRAQIVHRDIKPDNIFVSASSAVSDMVTVLDFGVAKLLDAPEMTSAGSLLGTPAYMAPEQAQGAPIDGRADLYSVGACMYFAACGRRPIEGATHRELLVNVLTQEPPALASQQPGIDPTFGAIVHRALAKEPAHRFGSAEEMSSAIQGWLAAGGGASTPSLRAGPVVAPTVPGPTPTLAGPGTPRTADLAPAYGAAAPPFGMQGQVSPAGMTHGYAPQAPQPYPPPEHAPRSHAPQAAYPPYAGVSLAQAPQGYAPPPTLVSARTGASQGQRGLLLVGLLAAALGLAAIASLVAWWALTQRHTAAAADSLDAGAAPSTNATVAASTAAVTATVNAPLATGPGAQVSTARPQGNGNVPTAARDAGNAGPVASTPGPLAAAASAATGSAAAAATGTPPATTPASTTTPAGASGLVMAADTLDGKGGRGACTVSAQCHADETCKGGACQCGTSGHPRMRCGIACVYRLDGKHCGSCDNVCAKDRACLDGKCETCREGTVPCDEGETRPCVSIDWNQDHCGGCNKSCRKPGFKCVRGVCQQP